MAELEQGPHNAQDSASRDQAATAGNRLAGGVWHRAKTGVRFWVGFVLHFLAIGLADIEELEQTSYRIRPARGPATTAGDWFQVVNGSGLDVLGSWTGFVLHFS